MASSASKSPTNGTPKSSAYEKSMKDLETEMSVLRSDIADISESLKNLGRAGAHDLNARARETAAALKAKGEYRARQATDAATAYYKDAENTVRENPAASVGIAAGVGFLIGLLLSRRS